MKTLSSIRFDILFQMRHGFYYVYGIITVLYIVILKMLPVSIRLTTSLYMIFSDSSVLGFFFIGGIILMEREQRTLESLFVTPLRVYNYFISKIVSLGIIALITSTLIMIVPNGMPKRPWIFIVTIILSSILFTLIGITLATRVTTINSYFLSSIIYLAPIMLPLINFLNIYNHPVFYIFPTQAILVLLKASTGDGSTLLIIYGIGSLLVWIALIFLWAWRWFYLYIIMKIGEGKWVPK